MFFPDGGGNQISLQTLTENTEVNHIVEGGGEIVGQGRKVGLVRSHSSETM